MMGKGKFFDGKKPVSVPVSWEIRDEKLIIYVENTGTRLPSWSLEHLMQDLDQNTAYVLINKDTGERLEIESGHESLPVNLTKSKPVEFRPKLFGIILVGIVLLFFGFWKGLPYSSKFLASFISEAHEQKISSSLKMDSIEGIEICKPGPESEAALKKMVARLYPLNKNESITDIRVEIVKGNVENAFTFPGGRIVIFNKLIENSGSPEELAGILAHEIGHVKERHILQKIINVLSFTALFQFIGGDFSSAFALDPSTILSLGSLTFDRGMEREADKHAFDRLKKAKVSTQGLASFFKRTSQLSGKLALLTTHPGSEERTRLFQEKDDPKVFPVLSQKEWLDLKNYCVR